MHHCESLTKYFWSRVKLEILNLTFQCWCFKLESSSYKHLQNFLKHFQNTLDHDQKFLNSLNVSKFLTFPKFTNYQLTYHFFKSTISSNLTFLPIYQFSILPIDRWHFCCSRRDLNPGPSGLAVFLTVRPAKSVKKIVEQSEVQQRWVLKWP